MTKRVQLVRHDNAGAQLFLGKEGECTVNTGNKSLHVHDGINQGGTELARADLVNVSVATSGNAGKMSAQQAAELAQALIDIEANNINNTNLDNTKADKVVAATANNVAKLDANGNLVDAGYSFSGLSGDVTFDLTLLNGKSFTSADDKIDNFPAGTKMVFQQTAAPTGWTKDTTNYNDHALRIVTGTVGNGGTDAFSTTFSASKATEGHTLIEAEIPAHTHGSAGAHTHSMVYNFSTSGGGTSVSRTSGGGSTPNTGSAGSHTHASFGGGGAHSHDITMDLKYVDVIRATKD